MDQTLVSGAALKQLYRDVFLVNGEGTVIERAYDRHDPYFDRLDDAAFYRRSDHPAIARALRDEQQIAVERV
jgi:hypothetical protein